jgi:hypothetical protein
MVDDRILRREDFPMAAELLLQHIAAVAVSVVAPDFKLPTEELERSLQHDGFAVDERNVRLIPAEGPVSTQEEQSRLEQLISNSALPGLTVIRTHLRDAVEHYVDGTKDHSSLGESRTLLQAVLDDVCEQIQGTGQSRVGLPSGTKNRWKYLEDNQIITADENAMFGSAWGFLSAGNHPGLPPREQARIGLLLAMEFSQVLIMKWLHWRSQNP